MTVVQGHTIRIEQLLDKKWSCKCLTCGYLMISDTEKEAWKDQGYHFGRLSTTTHPYGFFAGEDVPALMETSDAK